MRNLGRVRGVMKVAAGARMRRTVETDDAPKPVGPYSQAVLAGDFVFVAGQIGLDPATGQLVTGGTRRSRRACSTTSRRCCARRASTSTHVVKTTVYLVDLARDGAA